MNALDYAVLVVTLLGIAGYGVWKTRGKRDLSSYLKGAGQTGWIAIGVSVMATQASATTFLSTPGQGYESGLGFVQNYFGAPLALILIAAVFLPIYRRLKVYTAYEYLGHRFDQKTRLLGACLFLVQRGLGAGITIYAPAIVLSTVMGWRLDATIVCSGLLVIAYTVAGGSDAVTLTQKYQMGVIFAGMLAAFWILLSKLPPGLGFTGALSLAGGYHKLEAVDFSLSLHRRYTLWSGLLGGMFLALSYFGTDQSQVQRYLSGASLRESRLGLMFNAVAKIPMQLFILLLGVLIFVFYRFERPPVYFNRATWDYQAAHGDGERLRALDTEFAAAHADERTHLQAWMAARRDGNRAAEGAEKAFRRGRPRARAFGARPDDRGSRKGRPAFDSERRGLRLHHLHPRLSAPRPDRSPRDRLLRRSPFVKGCGTQCPRLNDDGRRLPARAQARGKRRALPGGLKGVHRALGAGRDRVRA